MRIVTIFFIGLFSINIAFADINIFNAKEIIFAEGIVSQNNFDTYKIAKMKDIPEIEITLVESDTNSKGVDFGVVPVAPAITNAIYAATGKRIRNLPIGKQKLV